MIVIAEKCLCCGCSACVQVCPLQCISVFEDNEGFLYPRVDESRCIDCGKCEKACPILHQSAAIKPLRVYAAKNDNEEIRLSSSSGGIFTLLAEATIEKGGVVFGARFDEQWEVIHDYTENKEGVSAFRGSKYVQSRMGNNYSRVETFLKRGRTVLFSGTPCQVAGLKLFLHREYDKLLTVDFVCHGVPSPKVWKRYLAERVENNQIRNIDFRSKKEGWKKYNFSLSLSMDGREDTTLSTSVFYENIYMRAFLADLILRPSCYACSFKSSQSGSDITIGDFWGIENVLPKMDDDKGCSLVLLNNEKSLLCYHKLNVYTVMSTYEDAVRGNSSIVYSANWHPNRERFFKRLDKTPCLETLITNNLEYPFLYKVKQRIKRELFK